MKRTNVKALLTLAVILGLSTNSVEALHSSGGVRQHQTRTFSSHATAFYANSESDRLGSHVGEQKLSRFQWTKPQPAEKQQEPAATDEEAVDEYLEFLDRRYRRLHDDEAAAEASKLGFSAWKWLKQDEEETLTDSQRQQDALYVLGVAGLASKKLLQKHHIEATQNQVNVMVSESPSVTDVPSQAPIGSMVPTTKVSILASEASSLLIRLVGCRKALHKYQSQKLKNSAAMLAKAPLRLGRTIWALGGGEHTVKVSLSCAMALTFVLAKPVAQFIASEGANITRGA